MTRSHVERFEKRFRVTPGCWIWQHGVHRTGYGQFKADGKNWRAHRFSYTSYVGPIPEGMCVCHACDNPKCVNPDHLWLGTSQENTADRTRKGRTARTYGHRPAKQFGTENGCAKLNDDLVRAIRKDSRSCAVIGRELGVSETTIYNAKTGKKWGHVK